MNDWLDGAFALPTRDGQDVGGAQERTMLAFAGGAAGIRTVEEINPDGSITRLRTRYGWPTFETEGARAAATETQLRGFVAKVPGGRAVLFDPYTMEILKTPYVPAAKLYEVQDFLTETTWYDVVLFDGSTIKVNAKAMPTLRITANHGYEAIPHVINYTVGDQYGNAERNTTEKRVFAVGRYSVTSWGGGGVTEALTPTEPRTESRALTIGQRIDGDTAHLGELYHGADGWDGATEWYFRSAEIQMLLTAAYLVKTSVGANVAAAVAAIAFVPGTATGSDTRPMPLPVAELLPVGVGEVTTTAYPDLIYIQWPYREIHSADLDGTESFDYSNTVASASASETQDASGLVLSVEMNNTKTFSARSKIISVASQTIDLPSDGTKNIFAQIQNYNGVDGYYWDSHVSPVSGGARGEDTALLSGDNISIENSATRAEYLLETQTLEFSVVINGDTQIVYCSVFKEQYSGEDYVVHPKTGNFDFLFENPYTGLDVYNSLRVKNDDALSVPVKEAGWANIENQSDGWIGTKNYAYAGTWFGDVNSSPFINLYYGEKVDVDPIISSLLSWETKDFILYDPTNEVYITVEGSFSGADNVATLTALLKVQTRHHTTTQTLGTFNYTYTEMLVEREIGTSGKYAVPSPQIRAIFAPLYCEQGSFKGAHYVTQAEEDGGIAAFHGFNFVLNLRMYSDFDTCNDDNAGQQVYFVPCNLLEMLYAFVFSTEYGVAEDGTRYPVTYTTRFNEMRDTLFATPVRVAVKDGSATNWTDNLGGDFAAVSAVALYRT